MVSYFHPIVTLSETSFVETSFRYGQSSVKYGQTLNQF